MFLTVVVDRLTFDESVSACTELVESGQFAQHVVINAGKCVQAADDPRLARIINEAALVNADGQSVVWATRYLGTPVPERVTGIDLMFALLKRAEDRAWKVYFLGAKPAVLDAALERLRELYPSLHIAGSRDGYFDDADAVARSIRDSGARVLFIAMPSPMKEYFVEEQAQTLGPLLAFGVGGSLDVVAGRTRRAPGWMQRAGLEWLYRLVQEPRRMWKRYAVGNTRFVRLVLAARREQRGRQT